MGSQRGEELFQRPKYDRFWKANVNKMTNEVRKTKNRIIQKVVSDTDSELEAQACSTTGVVAKSQYGNMNGLQDRSSSQGPIETPMGERGAHLGPMLGQ